MQPDIRMPYDQMAELAPKVIAIYAKHGVRIGRHCDLAKMIAVCAKAMENVGERTKEELLELGRAHRVLSAIVDCPPSEALKESLNRMASNSLNPAATTHSLGKDALFELEFLQYARRRCLNARLDEPDIVVSALFGDYFIACKTINSLKNLEKQLGSGTVQVERQGNGCIALNFEPHMSFEQPLPANNVSNVSNMLVTRLEELYRKYSRLFDKKLEEGRLDGVALQMSSFAEIPESGLEMVVFTETIYYSRSNLQDDDAIARFGWLKRSMQPTQTQPGYQISWS